MTRRADVTAALTALGPLRETVRLVNIDHRRNRHRFYTLTRRTTLWGDGVLVQFWAGWGNQAAHASIS